MKLSDLLKFKNITIQCHDNPDADAIGSGFALFKYFKEQGKDVRFIYGGRYEIKKSSLRILIEECEIPVEYVREDSLKFDGLLLMIDCQLDGGNVTRMYADHYAVIDHHMAETDLPRLSFVDSTYGSAATMVYNLLKEEGFLLDTKIRTALYYALYQDTSQFTEITGEADKMMRDEIKYSRTLFTRLKNANISLEDVETAGVALIRNIYNAEMRFSIMQVNPCDPNLLGLLSDFLLQVDAIDFCVVYNEIPDGIKISVRSCIKEVQAHLLADFLCRDMGSAGGRKDKAGGFISKKLYNIKYSESTTEAFFLGKINEFLHNNA